MSSITEKNQIYVDGKKLFVLLTKAQKYMDACDRVITGTRALDHTERMISNFVLAFDFKDERIKFIQLMISEFEAAKLNIDIMKENMMIHHKKPRTIAKQQDVDESSFLKDQSLTFEIYSTISRIETGIIRWKQSELSRK